MPISKTVFKGTDKDYTYIQLESSRQVKPLGSRFFVVLVFFSIGGEELRQGFSV